MATNGLIQTYKANRAARKLVKKTGGKTGSRLFRRLRANSVFLSASGRLSARISWSLTHGVASGVLCGADRVERAWRNGLLMRGVRSLQKADASSATFRKAVAVGADRSRIFALTAKLRRAFLHTRVRFFGIVGLFSALYAIGGLVLSYYFGMAYGAYTLADPIVAACLLLASVPLLFSGKPVNRACRENRLLSWLFLRVLGVDPASVREDPGERVSARGGLAFVFGTTLGLLSVFFSPARVLAVTASVLFCAIVLCVPEVGLMAAVILLPVAPLSATAMAACGAAVSYFSKFLRLKRNFRFGAGEAFLLLCVLAFWAAAWSGGETETAKPVLLYGLLWILTVNLVKTEALFRKFLSCLLYGGIFTLLLPAATGLLERFAPAAWQIALPEWGLSPTVLRCYLLTLLPIALFSAKRFAGFACLGLSAALGYLLGDPWLWLGALLVALFYFAVAHRAAIGAAVAGVLTVPLVVSAFGSGMGTLNAGLSHAPGVLLHRFWLTGIGAGEKAITSAAGACGVLLDGVSCGLYSRILLEGGIVQLIAFALTAGFALQCMGCCLQKEPIPLVRKICGGLAAGAAAFLVSAGFTDVFSDLRVLGVFFCICAAMTIPRGLYAGAEQSDEAALS